MSNCHVKELSKVVRAVIADAIYAYPALQSEFERDLERFDRTLTERGLPLLLVDMPAVRKHLDRCLSEGEYTPAYLPLTKRVSAGVVVPKFLRGLYLLIFEVSGALKTEPDTQAIFFLRQILSVCQKYTVPCDLERTLDTVKEFFEVDNELPEPDWFWQTNCPSDSDLDVFRGFSRDSRFTDRVAGTSEQDVLARLGLINLDLVSGMITSALGSYRPEEWKFRHGPGAISQVTRPTNKYNWFDWSERLDRFFALADYGYHSLLEWARSCPSYGGPSSEPRSRLIAVPKSFTAPRLIAAEPSEHQWCQQNLWHYFCERSRKSWISGFVRFRDQSLNQDLCLAGSRDGSLSTVDLSAASDRVSCHAVGNLFRCNPTLLKGLQACRTRVVKQEISTRCPSLHILKKFSTMGSACTFPVETLLFLSVALAGCLAKRNLPCTAKNIASLIGEVAVFGDDIVIPTDCRETVVRLLEVLHFKVNTNKSYWNGSFRESCGVDAFRGVNVTPVYVRKPFSSRPESVASNLQVSNNFFRKFMVHTSRFIASTLGRDFPIVNADSTVSGLTTFCKPKSVNFRSRYNRPLQRWEYLVPLLISKAQRTKTNDATALHQYFTEDPDPMFSWAHGFTQRPHLFVKMRWVPSHSLVLN